MCVIRASVLTGWVLSLFSIFAVHTTLAQDVTVNGRALRQRIDGFGASSAWTALTMSDAEADLFFSPSNGVGLSLLRVRIRPDGTTEETDTAQKAQARGAAVWASPWSPPGDWKTNGSTTNGGELLPSRYQDWANSLTQFVMNMKASGVNIVALSVQNEPDYVAGWDSCVYSGAQLQTFIRDFLGPTFSRNGITAKILMPETTGWGNLTGEANPTLADPPAAAYVGIVASHGYGGSPFWYPTAKDQGKALWQTEVSDFNPFDPSIGSGLNYAQQIHDGMTIAETNAWHYWWLFTAGRDNEGLVGSDGQIAKRLYCLGNFSKFVRPGYYRISTTGGPGGVSVSAYKNPNTGDFAIVAINHNGSPATFNIVLSEMTVGSVTPWETSGSLDLAQRGALAVSGGTFYVSLAPQSVTTLVGTDTGGSPTGPTIITQPASVTVTAGQTATFTVTATGTSPLSYQWQRNGTNILGATGASYTTPPTTTADSGSAFRVVVSNSAGSVTSQSATLTVNASSDAGIAINSGGGATGSFAADNGYSGGNIYSVGNPIDTSGVANPAPQEVYKSERYGNFTYAIAGLSPGASYTARLHFAEIFWSGTGQRVFNAAINGQTVLSNFDIFASAGGNFKAIVKEFPGVADGSGQIVIAFSTVLDNAKVSGIEIVPGGVSPPPPPSPSAPMVSITSPADGSSIGAGPWKTATVSVSGDVVKVELHADGVLRTNSTTAPFTMRWDTKKVSAGAHTLQCKAYNAQGRVGSSAVITVYK